MNFASASNFGEDTNDVNNEVPPPTTTIGSIRLRDVTDDLSVGARVKLRVRLFFELMHIVSLL